jgi:hypothetical protein
LVDARDLGSRDESRGGSSPSARTSRAVFQKLGRKYLAGCARYWGREE